MEFEKGQIIVYPVASKDGAVQNRYFHIQKPHDVLPVVTGYFINSIAECENQSVTNVPLIPNTENNIKEPFALLMGTAYVLDRRKTVSVLGHLRDSEQQIVDLYECLYSDGKIAVTAGIDKLEMKLQQQYKLLNAIEHDFDKVVKSMLDAGVNLNDYRLNTTLLHWAVQHNAVRSTAVLLSQGEYVDSIDCKEKTPLCCAVEDDKRNMAQLLLDAGASPLIRIKGRSIIEIAHNEKMRQILSQACPERQTAAARQKGRSC